MLTPQELKALSKISAIKSTWIIFLDWLGIAGLFWMNIAYPHPILYLVSLLFMARQQFALLVLVHDAAHYRLFPSRRMNDLIATLACGAVFFPVNAYRSAHMTHHRYPLETNDPDRSLTSGYPISKQSFWRKLKRDVMGISYWKFTRHIFTAGKPDDSSLIEWAQNRNALIIGGVETILILVVLIACEASVTHGLLLFAGLWVLPMMTLVQVALRIRGITEHAGYESNEDQILCTRTVINPFQTFFLAPHHVNYHIEHHLYPSIPWHQLPKAHQILKRSGSIPEKQIYTSYQAVLAELITNAEE